MQVTEGARDVSMMICHCRDAVAVVGATWLASKLLKGVGHIISGFRAYFLSPWLGLGRLNLAKYGAWAGKWNKAVWPLTQFAGQPFDQGCPHWILAIAGQCLEYALEPKCYFKECCYF